MIIQKDSAYYNENDRFAAAWLRELIKRSVIMYGDVDERSIRHVTANDLKGYTQCHFFAGIGTWSYALRLAGWPDSRPVWTGSCPCQPFSSSGKKKGFDDRRHLWPIWFPLIDKCRPATIFGEQVASKAGLAWLDAVQTDVESADYAFGAADLCAAGVGAPHVRQRLYFVADYHGEREHASVSRTRSEQQSNRYAKANRGSTWIENPWVPAEWIACADGKQRPVEPGISTLVDGAPCRVGRLRGYGNAIVAEVAKTFVQAFLDTESCT